MEYTTDVDQMQALLGERRGWSAMIWKFSPSLRRLALRLYRFEDPQELYLLGVGCETITGPFDWKGAEWQLSQETDKDGENRYWIRDLSSGFALRCNGGVVVLVGKADEFPTHFEFTQ